VEKAKNTNSLIFPERPRDIVSWLRRQPITTGEWLALIRRQARELTISEAALELGLSENRISQLAGPKHNLLKRSRRGFISTKSVRNYVLNLNKGIDYE